jgi:hypothetical protein
MVAGQWEVTSDHIAFDEEGNLMNGHHRLQAVVKSGCTVPMAVYFHLPRSARDKIDKGMARTGGQTFHMNGILNANSVYAICTRVYLYDCDLPFAAIPVNEHEIRAIYEKDPDLAQSLSLDSRRVGKGLNCIASVLGAMWYVCARIDKQQASEFFEGLVDWSASLDKDSPIIALRTRFLNAQANRSRRKFLIEPIEQGALMLKAWNAFRSGRKIRSLAWQKEVEEFPRAK